MNKQLAKDKVLELEKQVAELKAIIDKPDNGRYKPEYKEVYYFICFGKVRRESNLDLKLLERLYALGNCYRTREEAQAVLDRQLAKVRVIDRLRELDGGNEDVDWSEGNKQDKCMPYDDNGSLKIDEFWTTKRHSSEWYSLPKSAWKQVIKEMPDDVKLALIGEQ